MLTLPEVAKWRPAKDGTGPRTLRAFLESRPQPDGFALKSGNRKHARTSPVAQDLINAWVEDLHGEMTQSAVVELSGDLVSNSHVSELWRRLERPWIPEDVPGDVVGWRPAPDGTGPRTLRDFLYKRGDLPDGFTLKSKGRPGSRTSVVARGWINAWAAELREKMSQRAVTELSGGLINKVQVGVLWGAIANDPDAGVPEGGGSSVPGELTRPEVVEWRPAKDGTGPRTLRAFLESRPHPAGFELKSENRPRSSQRAQDWIDAWIVGLHREMTQAEVVELSDGVVSRSHVSELWHLLEGAWIPEDVPGDVVGWRPAPDGTGPRTFRDFLNTRGDLPAGFTLKSKGRPGSITSVVARGWINAWVAGLHGEMTEADVVEMSGGLISPVQVVVLWAAVARGVSATAPDRLGLTEPLHLAPQESAPPTRPEVAKWRPAEDGTGPRTLRAFLESRPHPPGFVLKSGKRPRSRQMAQDWIDAWVEGLHHEMTSAEVVDLSDGLVSRSHVSELWRRLEGSWVSEDVPGDVVGWRPAPDGTGPRTFRDFLNMRGDLPAGFTLKPKGRTGVRTSVVARGWINAWAVEKLREKMTQSDVVELSDGLINSLQVGALWAGLARESDTRVLEGDVPGGGGSSGSGVLTRPEVVGWRPAKDGTGPRTLRAFLESRPHPPGFALKSENRPRSSQMAQEWINAWVEDLHGEKMSQLAVAKLSGYLVSQPQVSLLWHGLKLPEIPEDVPGDVVGWRPAPDGTGPRTFRDFLNTRGDLPAGFTLKSKDQPGSITSVVAQGWINAWAADLHGEKMSQADVAELSGGLINKDQVRALWAVVAGGAGAGVPVRVAEEAAVARARSRELSRRESDSEGGVAGGVWEVGDLAAVPVGNVFGVAIELADV
ncbi:hypothetical protein, partial [Amycolatopsis sp. NPDC102389]|uniref:hypothetical protein n=1 Tax=Amycolatopsis sp. NPDC102389 TaxID=3363941 RepID=UPI0037F61748